MNKKGQRSRGEVEGKCWQISKEIKRENKRIKEKQKEKRWMEGEGSNQLKIETERDQDRKWSSNWAGRTNTYTYDPRGGSAPLLIQGLKWSGSTMLDFCLLLLPQDWWFGSSGFHPTTANSGLQTALVNCSPFVLNYADIIFNCLAPPSPSFTLYNHRSASWFSHAKWSEWILLRFS